MDSKSPDSISNEMAILKRMMRMTNTGRTIKMLPTEDSIKEMWSILSYFESESNVEDYLKRKFATIEEHNLDETKASLAFTMKAAKEFYNATESVTILTQPILLFYGMTALSKVLFIKL